jgi:hypothetical protein
MPGFIDTQIEALFAPIEGEEVHKTHRCQAYLVFSFSDEESERGGPEVEGPGDEAHIVFYLKLFDRPILAIEKDSS